MDSITQVLLGSAVAGAVAPAKYRKRAIITGAVLATIPDLDVLINYSNDVDKFTSHRGFSHSIIILPIFSIFLMPIIKRFYSSISWLKLYLLIMTVLVTHPLLDSLTSYGTQLFWPISVTPTFISSIFIVDPIYSFLLLLGFIFYLISPKLRWLNKTFIFLSTLYLVLGIAMQIKAKEEISKLYPKTTLDKWFVGVLTASPFCWRGVYNNNDSYIEVAFNILNTKKNIEAQYNILPPSKYPNSKALKRLLWFNPNTVFRKIGDKIISSDLRMGEFGRYKFEYIIYPPNNDGVRLPDYSKLHWLEKSKNSFANEYIKQNSGRSYSKNKWSQFTRCLSGEI